MLTSLYEISATLSGDCVDGRSINGVWGHEKQFHATRASAEDACRRLQRGGFWGCHQTPSYEVLEVDRSRFPDDEIGDQEWRFACKQAGVDPETGLVRAKH